MRRVMLLSGLTQGRCFTLAEPPVADRDDEGDAKKVAIVRSVLQPGDVWKVASGPGTEGDAGGVLCENALGETSRFADGTKVVEVPRQGFDRLVERRVEAGD